MMNKGYLLEIDPTICIAGGPSDDGWNDYIDSTRLSTFTNSNVHISRAIPDGIKNCRGSQEKKTLCMKIAQLICGVSWIVIYTRGTITVLCDTRARGWTSHELSS